MWRGLLVVIGLLVCWLGLGARAQDRPATDRHIVIMSLDGFPAYALRDPTLPLPNLRRLARDGVAAAAMQPVNPTVTWPNHTSVVTGVAPDRHGVLYNGLPVRGGEQAPIHIEPRVDKTTLVQAPTLYDRAHQAGLTTAEVDWVAIENAPTITWSFGEWPRLDGAVPKAMISAGLLTEAEVRDFDKTPITFRDAVWTQAAEHIITTHKPNLLLFHLLTTDSTQHRYGARSLGGNAALVLADARVGQIVDACRRAGILATTTFIVVSDHGFKTYRRVIRPNALLRQKGLDGSAWVVSEGGTAMVYVSGADKERTMETLRKMFGAVEGVARILSTGELGTFGYPTAETSDRMADLVLAAADGYSFDGDREGEVVSDVPEGETPGAHGYLNDDPDIHAIFVASGAGVKRGATVGRVRAIDVAPTAAHLLGLEMPNVAGRLLTEILEE